ncbi:MAG: winged helix-turn-helix transcriptional regulator [Candidatus Omnitrophica bacterium]|nr:winged helix-turn-helix transcriptional regulator [Candidatus Omnitrophota bacterium]
MSILKALSDRNRLRIFKLLERRKMCVCELAFVLGIKQPSVSRHLKKMKDAGIVDSEQDGLWTQYFLSKKRNVVSTSFVRDLSACLDGEALIRKDAKMAHRADRQDLYTAG